VKRFDTLALLLRTVPVRESDLMVTLFTQVEGKITAVARGARRSTKRFGGALEPLHELRVALEDRSRDAGTMHVMHEVRIERARLGLTQSLEAIDAAGRALRWVRHVCPVRTPEPGIWSAVTGLLDALDGLAPPDARLAAFGFGLLAEIGYELDFDRCVQCARVCPPERAACVDAARGGIVCASCRGLISSRTVTLSAAARRFARAAAQHRTHDACDTRDTDTPPEATNGDSQVPSAIAATQWASLLGVVEQALGAHAHVHVDPE